MTFEAVKNGVARYLDFEVLPQITGWQKWVTGASLSIYLEKGVHLFNELKENKFVKELEVIDKDNDIDIEKIYKYFLKEAKKSAVTFKAPVLGDITIKAEDVEKLYSYIKEGN